MTSVGAPANAAKDAITEARTSAFFTLGQMNANLTISKQMYADNIVLVSNTVEGLQNSTDNLYD